MNGYSIRRRISALILVLSLALALFSGACAETVWGDLEKRFADKYTLEYDGQTYRLRDRLTILLAMGVDRYADDPQPIGYQGNGQADFLMLVVVDDDRDTVQLVQLNRDTICEIDTMSVFGEDRGTRSAQLCLAHAYGDGREQSCTLTVRAVERLLMDTPIDHYLAMDMSGISILNDQLGGVQVTLEDDFSAYDASMRSGVTLTLSGQQAEYYLRYRYGVGDQTNNARLERQRAYLEAAKDIAVQKTRASSSFVRDLFRALDDSLITDVRNGYIVNLANKTAGYQILPILQIEGENRTGENGLNEFYPDADSLTQVLIEACYESAQ